MPLKLDGIEDIVGVRICRVIKWDLTCDYNCVFQAEILFKDENIVAIYELLDGFCEFIITNLSYIRWNKYVYN